MTGFPKFPVASAVALSLVLLFSACGGGGGGGGTQADPAQMAYKGVTTWATVTSGNAEMLALAGFGGGGIGSTVGNLTVDRDGAAGHDEGNRRLQRLALAIRKSTLQMTVPRSPAPASRLAPKRFEQFQVPGPDGGYAVYSLDVNDAVLSFAGSVVYYDYASQGIVLSGAATISGTVDPTYQTFTRLTVSCTSLTMRDATSAVTLVGYLSLGFNTADFTETLTINMTLVDQADGRTYWYSNCVLRTTYADTSVTQTYSGRYYEPDYGYVEITTEAPLVTTTGNEWPSEGAVMFSGRNHTWVRMTFRANSVLIEADTNGDGTADWQVERSTNIAPVPNSPPVANAGPDQNVLQGATVGLDGSASYDPDGDPLVYSWQFQSCPQNTCPGMSGNNTATPSFVASGAGTYVLGLTVYDGQAVSAMDTVVVTSSPVVPGEPSLLRREWQFGVYGTNIGKSGLFVSDLDGDGTSEIVASAAPAGFGANSLWYILKRNASGSYDQAWRSENDLANIARIALADVTGDGKGDLVVGLADGVIRVYDGPTRQVLNTLTAASPLSALDVGDVDGDGKQEIVTSDGTGVFVYSAESGGLKWSLASGGGNSIAVGNVDSDAAPEIVTSISGGRGYVIDGGSRTIEWDYVNGFGAQLGLGDVDGDGMKEIVGAAAWYKVTVFDADRKTPAWEIPTAQDIGALLVADADGDGVPEILYGDGQWGKVHAVDVVSRTDKWSVSNPEHGVSGIALGDPDKDGTTEVLWGAGGTSTGPDHLYVADPATGTIEWQNPHIDGPLSAVDLGDVDGDAGEEVVMVSRESDSGYAEGVIHVFDARTHALEYQAKLGITDWMGVRSVRIGDVDDDGKAEFVVTSANIYDGVIRVYDGATRALKRQSASYSGNYFSALAIADVDSDGKTEIVAGQGRNSTGAPGVYLLVFDGATMQEEWRSVDLGGYWGEVYNIALADVNGDGHVEIIASYGGNRLMVYDGVTHDLKYLADHPARALVVADIDGDGGQEILAGRDNGYIDVIAGSTFALEKTVFTSSGAPVDALRIADVEGDGIAEWLVAGGGFLSVLDGNNQALRWKSGNLSGNLGLYNHMPVRDIDGDGRKDIFLGSDVNLYHFK